MSTKQPQRYLPAAVYDENDPRARDSVRVVPRAAKLIKVGELILGYERPRQYIEPGSRLQGRAARRLAEISALGIIRDRDGEVPADIAAFLRVVVDALVQLPGRLSAAEVRRLAPRHETVSDDLIVAAMDAPRRPGRLLSNDEVGRMVGFTTADLAEFERAGMTAGTINPSDETTSERQARVAARDRANGADRARRARERQRAKSVTHEMSPPAEGGTFGVTLQYSSNRRDGGNVPPLSLPRYARTKDRSWSWPRSKQATAPPARSPATQGR